MFHPSLSGFLGGTSFEVPSRTFLARLTATPTYRRKQAYNNLQHAMQSSTWGAKTDVLTVLGAADNQAASLNSIGTAFPVTAVNSPTFASDRGYTGNGTTSYIHFGSGFATLTQANINSMTCLVWSLTDLAADGRDFGGSSGDLATSMTGRSSGGVLSIRANSGSTVNVQVADSLGLYGFARSSSTSVDVVKNGQVLTTSTLATSAVSAGNIAVGRGGNSYSTRQIAAVYIGAYLTAAEQLNLYRALRSYLANIGAIAFGPVYYTDTLEGAPRVYMKRADKPAGTIMRAPTKNAVLEYLSFTGNSTSVGSNGDAPHAITLSPPPQSKYVAFGFNANNSVFPFNGVARGYGSLALKASTLNDFEALYEVNSTGTSLGETCLSGAAAWLANTQDALDNGAQTMLMRTWGAAGQELGQLLPSSGANMWPNGLSEISAAVSIAENYGLQLRTYMCVHQGGHQDRSGTTVTTQTPAASGTSVITVDSTSSTYIGLTMSGTGIPAGAYVASYTIFAPLQITLSAPLTADCPAGTVVTMRANAPLYKTTHVAVTNLLQSVWKPITGQGAAIVIGMCQLDGPCSNLPTADYGQPNGPNITIAQLEIVRENPSLYRMLTSRYIFKHNPDAGTAQGNFDHFAPDAGCRLEGEYVAKQYRDFRRGGYCTIPGVWITVTRTGNIIKIVFFKDQAKTVPYGGLFFNTTKLFAVTGLCPAVPDGNFGFRYQDDSASATIASPPVITTTNAANDTVVITLTGSPTGANKRIAYADRGPGSLVQSSAWGNLFAHDDTPSLYYPTLTLDDPCAAFFEPVT